MVELTRTMIMSTLGTCALTALITFSSLTTSRFRIGVGRVPLSQNAASKNVAGAAPVPPQATGSSAPLSVDVTSRR